MAIDLSQFDKRDLSAFEAGAEPTVEPTVAPVSQGEMGTGEFTVPTEAPGLGKLYEKPKTIGGKLGKLGHDALYNIGKVSVGVGEAVLGGVKRGLYENIIQPHFGLKKMNKDVETRMKNIDGLVTSLKAARARGDEEAIAQITPLLKAQVAWGQQFNPENYIPALKKSTGQIIAETAELVGTAYLFGGALTKGISPALGAYRAGESTFKGAVGKAALDTGLRFAPFGAIQELRDVPGQAIGKMEGGVLEEFKDLTSDQKAVAQQLMEGTAKGFATGAVTGALGVALPVGWEKAKKAFQDARLPVDARTARAAAKVGPQDTKAYADAAKTAGGDINAKNAFDIEVDKLKTASKSLEKIRSKVGAEKGELFKKIGTEKIAGVKDVYQNIDDSLADYGLRFTKKGTIENLPGRTMRFDPGDVSKLQKVMNKFQQVVKDPTVQRVDDLKGLVNGMLYKGGKQSMVPLDTPVKGLLKNIAGQLDDTIAGSANGAKYSALNAQYSELSKALQAVKNIDKEGRGGISFLKSIYGDNAEPTKKALDVFQKYTGTDFNSHTEVAKYLTKNFDQRTYQMYSYMEGLKDSPGGSLGSRAFDAVKHFVSNKFVKSPDEALEIISKGPNAVIAQMQSNIQQELRRAGNDALAKKIGSIDFMKVSPEKFEKMVNSALKGTKVSSKALDAVANQMVSGKQALAAIKGIELNPAGDPKAFTLPTKGKEGGYINFGADVVKKNPDDAMNLFRGAGDVISEKTTGGPGTWGMTFYSPDQAYAQTFATRKGGGMVEQAIKKADIFDFKNPNQLAKLERELTKGGSINAKQLVKAFARDGGIDSGMIGQSTATAEKAIVEAVKKLGFKGISILENIGDKVPRAVGLFK